LVGFIPKIFEKNEIWGRVFLKLVVLWSYEQKNPNRYEKVF